MYWILAIVLFGVIIMLHELGHFLAAHLTGVGVMEFAVGFGPKLWSKKAKSGTTYSLRALPLGGYCRFIADDEDGVEDREDAFSRQKIWKRVLIAIGGPLMNLLTAVLLLFLLYFAIGIPMGYEPTVGALMPGYPAEAAGFQVGDRIVSVNGAPVASSAEAAQAIANAGDADIAFGIERGAERLTLTVRPRWVESEGRAMIGIEYRISPIAMRLGPWQSLRNAAVLTGDLSKMIFSVLRDLIFKGQGVEDLSGPIGTVVAIKEQTQAGGLFNYVYLAAMISVNLGLFNMLPVPGLDGSKLIFLLLEKIRGKRLDPNKEGFVLLVGFALMVGVMVLAMYQDIARLLQ